jgi:hypothetical protein
VYSLKDFFSVLYSIQIRDVHRGAAATGFFKERGAAAAGFLKLIAVAARQHFFRGH